jgi:hypothetical protein
MSYNQRETPVRANHAHAPVCTLCATSWEHGLTLFQILAELCTYLVEDVYGELAAVCPALSVRLQQKLVDAHGNIYFHLIARV